MPTAKYAKYAKTSTEVFVPPFACFACFAVSDPAHHLFRITLNSATAANSEQPTATGAMKFSAKHLTDPQGGGWLE